MQKLSKPSGSLNKMVIVSALVIATGFMIYQKGCISNPDKPQINNENTPQKNTEGTQVEKQPGSNDSKAVEPKASIPKLIDLGAGKCIPCKMMAPILEELKEEYKGRLNVVFIDVWKDPEEGKKYGIRLIPTQIFYDASGEELFRHEGFFSKQDILNKWKEFGIDLGVK